MGRRLTPRLLAAVVGVPLLCAPLRDAGASWPPAPGADLTNPANWPSDPDYASRWDYFSFLPKQAAGAPAYLSADQKLGASGMSIDRAWESSVGSAAVRIAIADSGILWETPDLIHQAWLNPAELSGAHLPQTKRGLPCGGAGPLAGYDCDGDGVFSVADYADDPRLSVVLPDDSCTDPATGVPTHGRLSGDVNHNCVLDAGDLIELFSDGVDDDANGYTDDIAGWDFFKNDNNPYDDARSGHGTLEALAANAEGDNGIAAIGACPRCRFVMLRAGEGPVVDSNDLAKALVYAADNVPGGGATVALAAVTGANLTAFARAAIDYAYAKSVAVVTTVGDEASRHHAGLASYGHTLDVHTIGESGGSVAASSSFLADTRCSNFGGQLGVSASGAGCSDEAAGRVAGVAGLIEAYALSRPTPLRLTAEEVLQLTRATADLVDVPESRAAATMSSYYESLAAYSQRFGYGRVNAAAAVAKVAAGLVPPEVDLTSPSWFETLYADRASGPVPLLGRVVATRATSYDVTVEWAPGVEPLDSEWRALGGALSNVPGQTVTGGPATPLALLDPSSMDTAHAADPDSPHHENDRTVTLRVRAVAHYPGGDARGEARRAIAIVNEKNGLDVDLLPGFPLRLGGSAEGGAKLADLTGDGVRDIVLATNDGLVHVFSVTAAGPAEAPGFPYALRPVDGLDAASPVPTVPSYLTAPAYAAGAGGGVAPAVALESVDGTPAVGDVNGDGAPDVVFASWAGTLYAVDHAGRDLPGWPQRLPLVPSCPDDPTRPKPPGDCMDPAHNLSRGAFASPVLADFEHNGTLDVVLAAFDGNVYVFRSDGTLRPGFPVRVHSSSAARYDRIVGTPAVADFDKDQIPDILVGTSETLGAYQSTGYFVVIDGRGTQAPGGPYLRDWPVQLPSDPGSPVFGLGTSSSPVAVDLGADQKIDALLQANGQPPLVVPADPGAQSGARPPASQLPALTGGRSGFAPLGDFGALSTAAPDTMLPYLSHPSVGDLDQDGIPDVVMSGGGSGSLPADLGGATPRPFQQLLAMWSGRTGQMTPGSPVVLEDGSFMTGQAIADLTGDGYPEVVAGTGGYFVHAVDACGREAPGWPKLTGGWVMGTPAVGDVTGDHRLEVVVTTREGHVYAWTSGGSDSGVVAWESFHHDNQNTGSYATALGQGALLVATRTLSCAPTEADAGGKSSVAPSSAASSGGCGCALSPVPGGAAPWVGLGWLSLACARRRRRTGAAPCRARRDHDKTD